MIGFRAQGRNNEMRELDVQVKPNPSYPLPDVLQRVSLKALEQVSLLSQDECLEDADAMRNDLKGECAVMNLRNLSHEFNQDLDLH